MFKLRFFLLDFFLLYNSVKFIIQILKSSALKSNISYLKFAVASFFKEKFWIFFGKFNHVDSNGSILWLI